MFLVPIHQSSKFFATPKTQEYHDSGGLTIKKNVPLKFDVKEELPDYWKKLELRAPGLGAELVLDYYNRRIKVMNFSGPFEELACILEALAEQEYMGKIIVYTPPQKVPVLETCGYTEEGIIRGYYSGEDCTIFSNYPKKSRENSLHKEKEDEIIKNCLLKPVTPGKTDEKKGKEEKSPEVPEMQELPEGYVLRSAVQADVPEMASFYMQGFNLYPTPLHMENYLLETMESSVLYLVMEREGKIVSLASAEMDPVTKSAEITDCLTDPSERGKGLIRILILALEKELAERNFKNAYTLCRAPISGINRAFTTLDYSYTGRLVNNCRIGEGFEDMNIWCKELHVF